VADETGGVFSTRIGYPALELVTPETSSRLVERLDVEPLREATATLFRPRAVEVIRQMAARPVNDGAPARNDLRRAYA
jgi:hypothetical protein